MIMHKDLIKKIKFFQNKNSHFITFIGPMLKPLRVEKDEYIYQEGDPIEEIYFLVSGSAALVHPEYDDAEYIIINEGYYFGEIDFVYLDDDGMNDGKRKFSVKASEECHLLTLGKLDLYKCDVEFEDYTSELFSNAMLRLRRTLKK